LKIFILKDSYYKTASTPTSQQKPQAKASRNIDIDVGDTFTKLLGCSLHRRAINSD